MRLGRKPANVFPPPVGAINSCAGLRDASNIAKTNRINEIGNGLLNANENSMSFTNNGNDNDIKSAINRVRNQGYTVPKKKTYKLLNCNCNF